MKLLKITIMALALFAGSSTASAWDDRVPGHAIKIVDESATPWALNRRGDIFQWTGRRWTRMPGTATDIGDGWVIGTDRRSGGYGIYRWNGRSWRRTSGGAVAIGGSYERPWVINDRNERFVWNGREWKHGYGGGRSSGHSYGNGYDLSYGRNYSQNDSRNYSRTYGNTYPNTRGVAKATELFRNNDRSYSSHRSDSEDRHQRRQDRNDRRNGRNDSHRRRSDW